jgi:hypothetical protein
LAFSPADPLYQAVTEAFNGVHEVHVTAHYLGCAPGTAGRAKFETKEGETPAWIRATDRRLD